MYETRQVLLRGVTADGVNGLLEDGARVVWIVEHSDRYNLVIETTAQPDVQPEDVVLDFLSHVSPADLEKRMLESPDLQSGPGTAALRALMNMLPGGRSDGA